MYKNGKGHWNIVKLNSRLEVVEQYFELNPVSYYQ